MCATTNREARAGRPHEGGVDYGTETAAMRSRGDVRGDEYGREGSGGFSVDKPRGGHRHGGERRGLADARGGHHRLYGGDQRGPSRGRGWRERGGGMTCPPGESAAGERPP